MKRKKVLAAVCTTGLAVSVVAVATTIAPASAATSFYTPPASVPSGHGQLVKSQAATLNLGTGAPSVSAWDMMYTTQDVNGTPDLATGTVIVPKAAWTGLGARPVVNYAPGTQGLAQSCAPSAQLAAGTEYETANIVAALNKGYAVVMTDYQGYTDGSSPLYIVGAAEGHAVLDASTAAASVSGAGITSTTPTAIWGYSQGGQSAAWAGQLQPSYDSSLNLVGIAAGGTPSDLSETASYLNAGPAAGFAAMAIDGLSNQYPSAVNLSQLATTQGVAVLNQVAQQCTFQALLTHEHLDVQNYTQGGLTVDQLLAQPAIAQAVAAQKLGTTKITVPLFEYHGQADEIIPLDEETNLVKAYCSLGVTDQFELYPSEHVATMFQAAPDVLSWISNRLGLLGKYNAPTSCSTSKSTPTSTAPAKSGDWLVDLNNWSLNASVHLKNLDADLALPSTSTFSGVTDLTTSQLQNGVITVPQFSTTLKAYGFLPLGLTFSMKQQAPATGSASLDYQGQLHIHGSVSEEFYLPTISFIGINLVNSSCQTTTPVSFPLDFDGPVSALGSGNLTFAGSTTFPQLTNCGLLTGALNLLFPGAGQTYSFTVAPPAGAVY